MCEGERRKRNHGRPARAIWVRASLCVRKNFLLVPGFILFAAMTIVLYL